MRVTLREIEIQALAALEKQSVAEAGAIAWACGWLEACGYPGIRLLLEALTDPPAPLALVRDPLGIDLGNRSCVRLAPAVIREVEQGGRAFLRNVRHGLYLLPFTVGANLAIGCPVDPAFAVGGERSKNPYGEKLAAAEAAGLDVDDRLWHELAAAAQRRP